MPNNKHKNDVKARVFNNSERNFPEKQNKAKSIVVRENCIKELGCRTAN